MRVKGRCPNCGQMVAFDDAVAGKRAKCRKCGATFSLRSLQRTPNGDERIAAAAPAKQKGQSSLANGGTDSDLIAKLDPPDSAVKKRVATTSNVSRPEMLATPGTVTDRSITALFQIDVAPLLKGDELHGRNVELGPRHWAFLIDWVVVVILFLLLALHPEFEAFVKQSSTDAVGFVGISLTWLLVVGVAEAFFGTSLGRKIFGIRIVTIVGDRPPVESLIIRFVLNHGGFVVGFMLPTFIYVLATIVTGRYSVAGVLAFVIFGGIAGGYMRLIAISRYENQMYYDYLAGTRVWRSQPVRPMKSGLSVEKWTVINRYFGNFLIAFGCLFLGLLFSTGGKATFLERLIIVALLGGLFIVPGITVRHFAESIARRQVAAREKKRG